MEGKCYPHLTDEETAIETLKDLPKITKELNSRCGTRTLPVSGSKLVLLPRMLLRLPASFP